MHESVGWGVAERHNAGAEPLRVDQFKRQRGLAIVEQALPVAYDNRPMTHIYAGSPRFHCSREYVLSARPMPLDAGEFDEAVAKLGSFALAPVLELVERDPKVGS